jgi:hypothetical protein
VGPPGSHSQKVSVYHILKTQEKKMWVLLADILKSQCLPCSQNSVPWYIDRRKALWRVVDSTVGKKKEKDTMESS